MSLEVAQQMEREMEMPTTEGEPFVRPLLVENTQNNSMYIYATAIILPLLIATIAIIGLPVNKESKSGTVVKIFAIILILISILGMYMYHKQIDILSMFSGKTTTPTTTM